MANAIHQAAVAAAQRHFSNLRDQQIFLRQMKQEARFKDLTSPAGAQGPAQIMPDTARAWGVRNVHDAHQAFEAAAAHMASYLHQFGSWDKALAAYNAGPGAVGRPLPAETRNYISTILGSKGNVRPSGSVGGLRLSGGTPGRSSTSTDTRQAIIDSLLSSPSVEGSIHKNLLGEAVARINSGAYTTTTHTPGTPIHGTIEHGPVSVPAHAAKAVNFDGKPVASWIAAELKYAREHGWSGTVTSGYRSPAEQAYLYSHPGAHPGTPAAKPGHSEHNFLGFPGGAVDVTDPQGLAHILATKPGGSPLKYAGAKDPVHFSHPENGHF